MAKSIATIGGIGLAPGVSKNRRLYSPQMIARAVGRAQDRLKAGAEPMVMLTHHGAEDDSRAISGSLNRVSLDEDGRLRWRADIPDTPAGRDIATLADTSDGRPAFLQNVSIRGHWLGTVRKVKGPDGEPVETADDLEIDGLDFTRKPGVPDARIDTFAWAGRPGQSETTVWVPITENVQEALVTISEETAPTKEAAGAQTAAPPGTTYADPGYLKDKKKRYPLNSAKRIRAAWSYINQKDNAGQYTAQQLKRIKGKIRAAMKRIGATVAAEGWVIWPADTVTETAAELDECYAEMASPGGTFCVEASNGPISIRISSYCIDPADLDLILRNACEAADVALKSFDPDMDADIDLPGAGDISDPDHDAPESGENEDGSAAEAAPQTPDSPAGGSPVSETSPTPVTATSESEAPAMAETTAPVAEAQIPASAGDPSSSNDPDTNTNPMNDSNPRDNQDDASGNNFEAFLADMITAVARQAAADGKVNPAYAQLASKLVMSQALGQNGPLASASVALTGAGSVPAPHISSESAPAQPVAEQRPAAAAVTETAEQRIERLVAEGIERKLTEEKQRMTEQGGGPVRKGLVRPVGETATADTTALPEGWPQKDLSQYTAAEWKQHVEPYVAGAVFDGRREQPA